MKIELNIPTFLLEDRYYNEVVEERADLVEAKIFMSLFAKRYDKEMCETYEALSQYLIEEGIDVSKYIEDGVFRIDKLLFMQEHFEFASNIIYEMKDKASNVGEAFDKVFLFYFEQFKVIYNANKKKDDLEGTDEGPVDNP